MATRTDAQSPALADSHDLIRVRARVNNPSGEETHAAAWYSWMSPPNTFRRRTAAALRSLTTGHRLPIGV